MVILSNCKLERPKNGIAPLAKKHKYQKKWNSAKSENPFSWSASNSGNPRLQISKWGNAAKLRSCGSEIRPINGIP